jgi:AbrB family looped-hinge helix DNA binding protein
MAKMVTITGSGQITLPSELRRKHGLKIGDQVMVSENAAGRIEVKPKGRSFEELSGSIKARPGMHVDDDFGNVIREAMEEAADRLVARMNAADTAE